MCNLQLHHSPPDGHFKSCIQPAWSAGVLEELEVTDVHALGEEVKRHVQFPHSETRGVVPAEHQGKKVVLGF